MKFYNKYKADVYSQNGEDGIIKEILTRINLTRGICVEFGAADGKYCSNTRRLKEIGWNSAMYDLTPADGVIEKVITPENVNELPKCHVLSIDIDGNDFEVWKAYKGKPQVVVIEINSSFPIGVEHFSKEQGCSYTTMKTLGEQKGYFLVCHTGNLVFVNQKFEHLFPELKDRKDDEIFNTSWL